MNAARLTTHGLRLLLPLGLGLSTSGCFLFCLGGPRRVPPGPLITVDGPESPQILDDVHGWVLYNPVAGRRLEVTELPSNARHELELAYDPDRMSGPDDLGRIVYLAEAPRDDWHQLRVIDVHTGVEQVLVERRGNPNWHSTVWFLELAPRGGHVALGALPYDKANPFNNRNPQELEIWNLADGSHVNLGPLRPLSASWFPDGERLLVERLVPLAEVGQHEPLPPQIHERSRGYMHVDYRPSLQILEIATGNWSWVCWGFEPMVSPDGKRFLYRLDENDRWVRDIDTGAARAVELPGAIPHVDPLAWLSPDILLYSARATTGQDPGVRTVEPWPCTVQTIRLFTAKAARIDTREFVTVIPTADGLVCAAGR